MDNCILPLCLCSLSPDIKKFVYCSSNVGSISCIELHQDECYFLGNLPGWIFLAGFALDGFAEKEILGVHLTATGIYPNSSLLPLVIF